MSLVDLMAGDPYDIKAEVLDYSLEIREFKLQIPAIGLMGRVLAKGPGDQSSI